jgi:hypothetical protein
MPQCIPPPSTTINEKEMGRSKIYPHWAYTETPLIINLNIIKVKQDYKIDIVCGGVLVRRGKVNEGD